MHKALAAGMDRVFLIAFVVGLAMLAVTIFLPEIPLQREEFFETEEAGEERAGRGEMEEEA